MKSLLTNADIKQVNRKSNHVQVHFRLWREQDVEKEYIKQLTLATRQRKKVFFDYTNGQGVNAKRIVEPYQVLIKQYASYLFGYCLEKEDFRFFRLSRMIELQMLEEIFQEREHEAEYTWDKSIWMKYPSDESIILRFTPQARVRVLDSFEPHHIQMLEDGSSIVTIDFPHDEWVDGIILGFGAEVEVLQPPHFRERIKEKAKKIWDIYKP